MQALESDPAVIPFPASEGEAPTTKGNYEAVRFNAMKHGILSRYTVLIGYVVKDSRKSAPDRIAAAHVVDPV